MIAKHSIYLNMSALWQIFSAYGAVVTASKELFTFVKNRTDPYPIGNEYTCIRNYGRLLGKIRDRKDLKLLDVIRIIEDYWRRFEDKYGKEKAIYYQEKAREMQEVEDDGVRRRDEEFERMHQHYLTHPWELLGLCKEALVIGKDDLLKYITNDPYYNVSLN